MNDTMILLFSDHGFHMNGLYKTLGFENVDIEMGLATMMFTADEKYLKASEKEKYFLIII